MSKAPTRGSTGPSAVPRVVPPKGGFKPIGPNATAGSDDACWAQLMDVIGCDDAAIAMISRMEQEAAVKDQLQEIPKAIQDEQDLFANQQHDKAPSYSWSRPRCGQFSRSMIQSKLDAAFSKKQHTQPTSFNYASFGAPEDFIYQVNMDPNSFGQKYNVVSLPANGERNIIRSTTTVTPESPPIKTLTFTSVGPDAFAPLSPSSQSSLGSVTPSLRNSGSLSSVSAIKTDDILSSIPPPPMTPFKTNQVPVSRSASYGGPGKCLSTLQEHRRQQEEDEKDRIRKEQEAAERERMRKAQEAAALAFAHKRAVAIAAQRAQEQASASPGVASDGISPLAIADPSTSSIIEKESAPVRVINTFKELKKDEFDFHSGASDKTYFDFSKISEDEQALPPEERNTGGVVAPFPLRLHDMLYQNKFPDIITWAPHGRAFIVHKPKEFETRVLCRYFNQTKYRSFQRQLNLYGFRRMSGGDADRGAYYHELFLRGRRKLCTRMKRRAVKGPIYRPIFEPELEPNFYAMSPLYDNGPGCLSKKPAAVAVPNVTS